TPRTASMPNQTAARAPTSVPTTYAAATAGRPAASRTRVCTAYVEKVVNPPSTPVPRNGRTSRCGAVRPASVAMSTPIAAQPLRLVTNVAQGKPVAGCGQAVQQVPAECAH